MLGALHRRTEDCLMPFEDVSCAQSGAIAVKVENIDTVGVEAVPAVVEQLANAAEGVSDEREAKAVLHALSHTPGLSACAIAPDVLAKLLPDDEVVELPKLARVHGGPIGLPNASSMLCRARSRWRSSPFLWVLSLSK